MWVSGDKEKENGEKGWIQSHFFWDFTVADAFGFVALCFFYVSFNLLFLFDSLFFYSSSRTSIWDHILLFLQWFYLILLVGSSIS